MSGADAPRVIAVLESANPPADLASTDRGDEEGQGSEAVRFLQSHGFGPTADHICEALGIERVEDFEIVTRRDVDNMFFLKKHEKTQLHDIVLSLAFSNELAGSNLPLESPGAVDAKDDTIISPATLARIAIRRNVRRKEKRSEVAGPTVPWATRSQAVLFWPYGNTERGLIPVEMGTPRGQHGQGA